MIRTQIMRSAGIMKA